MASFFLYFFRIGQPGESLLADVRITVSPMKAFNVSHFLFDKTLKSLNAAAFFLYNGLATLFQRPFEQHSAK